MAVNTGQFGGVVVTDIGKVMISKSQGGQKLEFKKIVLGDGVLDENTNYENLTEVKNKVMECEIADYEDLGNGQFELTFTYDNSTLDTGFWHREIGVIASIDDDDALYAYAYAGTKASFMYDKTTPISTRTMTVTFVVGNASNISVVLSNKAYMTRETVENIVDQHDDNADAHQPLLNKWINKSFSKFKEAVIGVVKDALTDILDIQAKMDTNGFVRMGFLWGFTIQWGYQNDIQSNSTVTFPVSFNNATWCVIPIDINLENNPIIFGTNEYSKESFIIAGRRVTGVTNIWFKYIAIGN